MKIIQIVGHLPHSNPSLRKTTLSTVDKEIENIGVALDSGAHKMKEFIKERNPACNITTKNFRDEVQKTPVAQRKKEFNYKNSSDFNEIFRPQTNNISDKKI